MAGGKIHNWKHGWIPVSPAAKAYVAGNGPKPTSKPKPINSTKLLGKNYSTMTAGDKIKAAETMYGTGSPQHKAAIARFADKKARPAPRPTIARINSRQKEVTGMSLVKGGQAEGMLKSIQENGGFTYDPSKGGLVEVGKAAGFAIAIPGTETTVGREKVNGQDITREDFAKGIAEVIRKNKDKIAAGAVIGGWYSPDRNTYMVELTEIYPPNNRDAAITVGKERNQEAIFDLATGETIVTGGTGDVPKPDAPLSAVNGEMTPEQIAAAKYYSGPGFYPLNTALRKGVQPPLSVKARQADLDALLVNSKTTAPVTTYRGLKSWPGFPKYMAPGSTYADAGYMSTAVADAPPENYTGDVTMSISVPAGANALDLNAYGLSHHPNEKELLLPHGSRFRVISDVPGADGKRMISMELITGLEGGEQ